MEPQEGKEETKTLKVEKKAGFNSKTFDLNNDNKMNRKFLLAGVLLLIIAGFVTGYFLAKGKKSEVLSMTAGGGKIIKSEKVVGSLDEVAFPDSAEGQLEKGGIDSEGTHKLIREGGPSQYVYLTSSLVNLDEHIGKKVKVWGETFRAEKAGWLMDVGRLEILE